MSTSDTFPEVHYPSHHPIQHQGTVKLSDGYGCFSAANLITDEEGGKRFRFQYHRDNGAGGGRLEAREPLLPLLKPSECDKLPLPSLQDLGRWSHNNTGDYYEFEDRASNQAVYLYKKFPQLIWGSALDFLQDSYVDTIEYRKIKSKKFQKRQQQNPIVSLHKLKKKKDQLKNLTRMLHEVMYDIHPKMLISLLKEDIHDSINKQYIDPDFYGGCLAYHSLPSSSGHEGLLFYPSGPTFEILNIQTVPHQSVPIYSMKDSPGRHFSISSPLRQIETIRVPNRESIIACLRTDYQCCVMKVMTDSSGVKGWVSNLVHSQQKIASVALSPYIFGECLMGLDTGGIQLIEADNIPRSILNIPEMESRSPIRCHFGGHPRLVVTNQRKSVDLVDCRSPVEGSVSCLLSLPSETLPHHQEIYIAKQHPSNHFYHFVATQDMLLLLDERFPNYNVLQWCHSLSSPPNCMDIVTQAVTSESLTSGEMTSDLIVLGSQYSREVHCFQCNELNGQTPESTSLPWKLASTDGWLDLLPEYPAENLDSVRSRLERPLMGVCAAKRSVGEPGVKGCEPGVTVFQLSSAGDVFFQSFSQRNAGDDWQDKTLSSGPGSPAVTLNRESLSNCKEWIEDVLHQQPSSKKVETSIGFSEIDHCDAMQVLKSLTSSSTTPDGACNICHKNNHPREPDSTAGPACPACGVKVPDGTIMTGSEDGGMLLRGDDEDEVMLPWRINPGEYRDEMSKVLHHRWVDGYDGRDEDDGASGRRVESTPTRSQKPSQPFHTTTPFSTSQKRQSQREESYDMYIPASQSLDVSEQQRAGDLQSQRQSSKRATDSQSQRQSSSKLSERSQKKVKRNIMGF